LWDASRAWALSRYATMHIAEESRITESLI
jgi:hypothetical protein